MSINIAQSAKPRKKRGQINKIDQYDFALIGVFSVSIGRLMQLMLFTFRQFTIHQ